MPKGRVLVAMSGGVDSSVAAALLKDQGYEVIGMTMQVWDYSSCDIEEGFGTCCSSIDVDDARSVADKLEIPFYVLNCEAKFQAYVIDPFVDQYIAGKTPLPCVNCNTYLKFDHLFEKMQELGCDKLATGHYAQIAEGSNGPEIVTSEDSWKDQTYFLFTLQRERLKSLIFPVGHLKKPKLREIAEERGLVNARKKDSTGICFIGPEGYGKFINDKVAPDLLKKGLIKRFPDGEVLGSHIGIHNFTYGQRRGLGLDHHETLFVLKIEGESNTVWVGDESYLYSEGVIVEKVNWLSDVKEGEEINVKVRYMHKGAKARIYKFEVDKYKIQFEEPQRAITPGQAAVFYKNRVLCGGGWIINATEDIAERKYEIARVQDSHLRV